MPCLCPGVLDVVEMQKQLIRMSGLCSAIFRSPVCECTKKSNLFPIKKWQDLVVQEVGCCDRSFVWVKLGKADIRKCVNPSLLIDLSDALDVANIIGVLAKQEARVEGL